MEDFISELYKPSFVIDGFKEYIFLMESGRPKIARDIYNTAAVSLEALITRIAVNNEAEAINLQTIALRAKGSYDDHCLNIGIIKGELIPALYNYMQNFTGIDVSEGNYTLMSTDSGFLTVKDNEQNIFLHDTHDPMEEARNIASTIYQPNMQGFLILGCGLGYLAYQLYKRSNGAIKIYIYENDKNMIDYALKYGVLSLIPDKLLYIVCNDNCEKLGFDFLNTLNTYINYGFIVSHWKETIYNSLCNKEINRINTNHKFELETSGQAQINLWKNRLLPNTDFNNLSSLFKFDEWIVISAGPSLDENISFIKDSSDKRGLIAVNTVLERLIREGIHPNLVAAADQSNSMAEHIKNISDMTSDIYLIADWVLNWKYTHLYKGNICFIRTNASEALTQDFIPDEQVWDISGTVASLALEAVVRLNAKIVYLVGQDLAYPAGKMYAKGLVHIEKKTDAKYNIKTKSVDGGMVDTCDAFEWFKKALEYQIAKYNHVDFINLSKHGALINGARSM